MSEFENKAIIELRKMSPDHRDEYVNMITLGAQLSGYMAVSYEFCQELRRELESLRKEDDARANTQLPIKTETVADAKAREAEAIKQFTEQTAALEKAKASLAESIAREKELQEELFRKINSAQQDAQAIKELQGQLKQQMQLNQDLLKVIVELSAQLQKDNASHPGLFSPQTMDTTLLGKTFSPTFFATKNDPIKDWQESVEMTKVAKFG